jgi:hypothetical protein
MRIYIANFGRENWAWDRCRASNSIILVVGRDQLPFWEAGDREGFINYSLRHFTTAMGNVPPKPLASRWFNLPTILHETENDIWLHRASDELWWTQSLPGVPRRVDDQDPTEPNRAVVLFHKPCSGWSNLNRQGRPLAWNSLHRKAQTFLFTEGTFQQPSPDNAAYTLALIDGRTLTIWHDRPDWQQMAAAAGRTPARFYSAQERTITRIAGTVEQTVTQSQGDPKLVGRRLRELHMNRLQLEEYVRDLLIAQESRCALTGLQMLLDGEDGDHQLRCSLDRINSDGQYEVGNLQIVCKFANFWKRNQANGEFLRLIELVRSHDGMHNGDA